VVGGSIVSVVGEFIVPTMPIELALLLVVDVLFVIIVLAFSERWCSVNAVALCHQASDHS